MATPAGRTRGRQYAYALGFAISLSGLGCAKVLGDFNLESAATGGAGGGGAGGSNISDASRDVSAGGAGRSDASLEAGCVAGSTLCQGKSLLTCKDGIFQNPTTCPYLCTTNGCTGVCSPGQTRCTLGVLYTCKANADWDDGAACTFPCQSFTSDAGPPPGPPSCGICDPGSTRCMGNTLQTCNAAASQWTDTQQCPFFCTPGTNGAQCTGTCAPSSVRCDGNQPQVCNSLGAWDNTGLPCTTNVCVNGVCMGQCVTGMKQCMGNTVQTCVGGTTTTWVSADAPCQFACISGACTACVPGSTQCVADAIQTCQPDGTYAPLQPCAFVCRNNVCSGECASGTRQCAPDGMNLQDCNQNGQWMNIGISCTFGCQMGACLGCTPGTKRCVGNQPQICDTNGAYVPNGSCAGACLDGGTCAPTGGG